MIKSKNYKLYIFLIFLLVIVFYYQMVQSGISTHDELLNIYLVRMGEFFENRTWERWGMLLMSIVPSYLHASCTNLWLYKALTLAGILIACSSFGLFIRKVSGNNATFIFFILFFFLGQFENEHNGLYSFSFSYQMNTAYVFIGLSLYYEYLKNRKTRYIIVSAVFYLLSSMAYEAFILYGILFFLIDLYPKVPSFYTKDYVGTGTSISS